MTSIEEALRSGAVRLVPVEATQDMAAAGEVALLDVLHSVDYYMPDDGMRRIFGAALAASPDHTPALLALIEERDRLKVERDEAVNDRRLSYNLQEHAIRQRDAAIVEREEAWQTVLEAQGHADSWRDRALAAEAKCDALREALAPFGEAAALWENCADDSDIWTRNLSLRERIKAGLTISMLRRARALTQETADVGE